MLNEKALAAAAAAVRAEWKSLDQKLALPAGASQSIAPTNHGLLSAAIAAYLSAILPEDAAGLVERLLAGAGGGSHWMELHRDAASLIQSQAARIAELEAGLERAVEIAQEYVPHLPPDGPSSAEHQVAYDTAGFLYRDLFRHARALLNGERKG